MEPLMDKNFVIANEFTKKWEKGYVNHPKDPGGITYNGVSLRFIKSAGIDVNGDGHVDHNDIVALYKGNRQDLVDEIFYKAFWRDAKLEDLKDVKIQTVVYDCNVNTGRGQSIKFLQRALNSVLGIHLTDDGKRGPKTNEAINVALAQDLAYKVALEAVAFRKRFHQSLANNSPYKDGRDYRPFIKGWLNRCNDLENYIKRIS